MAEEELLEAGKLNIRCPRWYREVLFLGMVTGVSAEEFDQVYEEAVKLEPNYLQFYLIKSEHLTPKWNGKPGDWQKFVDSLPSKLVTFGTDETDMIYFVTVVNKLSDASIGINWAMLSKDRIQKGFADIEKKYGEDNMRLNQYAFVSCLTVDFAAAQKAFERIGDDWNGKVWSKQTFDTMKKIATEQSAVRAQK